MKKKMIFALLLAGSMFGMVNNATAQATCSTNCGGGSISCSGESCTAEAGDSVSCRSGRVTTTIKCPKVVAPA